MAAYTYPRYTRFRSELNPEGGIRFGSRYVNSGVGLGQGNLQTFAQGAKTIVYMDVGVISVVVPAQVQATSTDIADIAVTGAAVGDNVVLNPPTAAVESGLVYSARVKAAGFITVNIGNLKAAAALTGSTSNWAYTIIRGATPA